MPETSYEALAFGYDGGATTKLSRLAFNTPKANTAADVTFTFALTGKENSKIIIEPSDESVLFLTTYYHYSKITEKKKSLHPSDVATLSEKRDSNPRPSAWEADALPTELFSHWMFANIGIFQIGYTLPYIFLK